MKIGERRQYLHPAEFELTTKPKKTKKKKDSEISLILVHAW